MAAVYFHSSIRLYGIVLNQLSTENLAFFNLPSDNIGILYSGRLTYAGNIASMIENLIQSFDRKICHSRSEEVDTDTCRMLRWIINKRGGMI
jgi:hypothetical protein